MKVSAYLHAKRIGRPTTGVGKHMINMCRGLAAKGVDVRALIPRNDLDGDGQISKNSDLHGMPVNPLPFSRLVGERLWALTLFPKVDRWAGYPDWVYCPAEVYIPAKAPLAATVHCVNWFEKELPWYNDPDIRKARVRIGFRYRQIFKRANLILTVSEFLKGRIVELFGVAPERIAVVGNGVEDPYFDIAERPREPLIAHEKRPYVLTIGGLTTRKGADCIFSVADELIKRKSDLEIRVAGVSEPAHLERSKSYSNITHAGFLHLDKLPPLVRGAEALLFISRYETFGIPAVEAMAAGTPAIVSHFAGQPEVVGDAGIVIDPAKTAEIADMLINLSQDGELRDRYAALGRSRAAQYHWSACVDRLIEALK